MTLPPGVAAWFVELFASPQEADGIVGDLAEEFSASVARDGDKEARRRYRRQAWRTIRDLAVTPWIRRPWSHAGIACSGLLLIVGMGFAGLEAARSIVARYPVYHYVPASLYWGAVDLVPALMTGFIVALIAPALRFRPMSAALALVAATAVLVAVDRPVMMWLYGVPLAVRVTLTSSLVRWALGVLKFGGVIVIGAAAGRKAPFRDDSVQLRPHAE